ncbi:glycoside hydrolase N-terminal domain-containing protein [Bacteroidota bacterium]
MKKPANCVKRQKFELSSIFLGILIITSCNSYETGNNERIWYEYPAEDWGSQALHLGNGLLGVSFYGGVQKEEFDLTERTMWTGGPGQNPDYSYGNNTGGKDYIDEIRREIVAGNIKRADQLVEKHFLGDYSDFGHFSMFGSLHFLFDNHEGAYQNYIRELDLSSSLARVAYEINDIRYNREYFCSYPNRVLVIKFQSKTPGKLGFTMFPEIVHEDYSVSFDDDLFEITGKINGNEREFRIKIKILHQGGSIEPDGESVHLLNASEAVIMLAAATEYLPEPPLYKGANPDAITASDINNSFKLNYEALKETHIRDYKDLYNRVYFELEGNPEAESIPTNIRLENFKKGKDDPGLKTLMFNFGRYVLISSSRPGGIPIAHTGSWNNTDAYPYAFCCQGNIQSNVNVQLAYQPCGPLNLPECHRTYIDFIKNLVTPGRETAEKYYGTNGWVSHTTANIWGYTAPGRGMLWGIYPSGAAWHCRHLWEQYTFTMDKEYLKNEAYPVMAEAAQFWLENLVPYREGLIIAPTVPAEQGAEVDENENFIDPTADEYTARRKKPEYYRYNITGPFQDIEMVWDLFTNVLEAADVLGIKNEFTDSVKKAKDRLIPLKIGRLGQLQEWYKDIDSPKNHHRHLSHMYALHPGWQIDPFNTPELAEAAKKSLQMRGYGHIPGWPNTGLVWSESWRMYCWARLLDHEIPDKILNRVISEDTWESLMTAYNYSGNNGITPDATIALAGCMVEMLLQSHLGEIHILPALPSTWPDGKVEGILARGGYKVDIEWIEGHLHKAKIVTLEGGIPTLRIEGQLVELEKDDRIQLVQQ